jgi:hypothetical protein
MERHGIGKGKSPWVGGNPIHGPGKLLAPWAERIWAMGGEAFDINARLQRAFRI